jgi:hypothetical protein
VLGGQGLGWQGLVAGGQWGNSRSGAAAVAMAVAAEASVRACGLALRRCRAQHRSRRPRADAQLDAGARHDGGGAS